MTDFILMADWMQWIIGPAMFFTSFFLILLVLVQRGRGGGLAGALGGAGGQSAFGTKAGDVFTKITVGFAAIWILLCVLALTLLQDRTEGQSKVLEGLNPPTVNVNQDPDDSTPLGGTPLDESPLTDPSETSEGTPLEDGTPATIPSTTESETEATTEPAEPTTETPAATE